MPNTQRSWRLTRASVASIAQAFNMSSKATDQIATAVVEVSLDADKQSVHRAEVHTIEALPQRYELSDAVSVEFRAVFHFGSGFYFPVLMRVSTDGLATGLTAMRDFFNGVRNSLESLALNVDNLSDAERDAKENKPQVEAEANNTNGIMYLRTADPRMMFVTLWDLVALSLARGSNDTVVYIPREVALKMDVKDLRALGNVETYEIHEGLGNPYLAKTLDQAIIVECHTGEEQTEEESAIIKGLIETLHTATQLKGGRTYSLILTGASSDA